MSRRARISLSTAPSVRPVRPLRASVSRKWVREPWSLPVAPPTPTVFPAPVIRASPPWPTASFASTNRPESPLFRAAWKQGTTMERLVLRSSAGWPITSSLISPISAMPSWARRRMDYSTSTASRKRLSDQPPMRFICAWEPPPVGTSTSKAARLL